jgi:hypothetical protein
MRARVWLLLGVVGLLALGGFTAAAPPTENLRLVVMLRPASPGVVPLQPGEPALYTFEVFGVDEANRRRGISDQVFVHHGRRRKVQKRERGLEITGLVDLSGTEARYQVKLLSHGRQVAATGASITLERSR